MAIMSVTNTSGGVMNALASGGYGSSPDAVGGVIANPLPYPFNKSASLANGATRALPMHQTDLHTKPTPAFPMEPVAEWNQLVQAGKVTVSFAKEATSTDVDEALVLVLGA